MPGSHRQNRHMLDPSSMSVSVCHCQLWHADFTFFLLWIQDNQLCLGDICSVFSVRVFWDVLLRRYSVHLSGARLSPKATPNRPRGSILLSQRGPTGLSVKSCPAAPPDRSVSLHHWSSASAAGFVESGCAAGAARASAPSAPRAAAADPSASAAGLAPLRLRRSKRSTWRET